MDAFVLLLQAHNLPLPQTEFQFAPGRKYRADYAWPAARVLVEQEGGLWSRGRAKAAHAQPLAILRDMAKSNLAQTEGWTYLRFTPQQLASGEALPILREVLGISGCR